MDLKEKKKLANTAMAKFLKAHDPKGERGIKVGFLSDNPEFGKVERLETGILPIDILSGGGLIKGQINQIYGSMNVGKSTTFLNIIAHQQKINPDFTCAYLNNEKTFDAAYAIHLGVDPDRFTVFEADTQEASADFCIAALEGGFDLLIVDTLQALAGSNEIKSDKSGNINSVESNTMALLPRLWSQFLRMYTSKSLGKMTLLLGSQVRMDLAAFKPTERSTGGNAIKHYNVLTMGMHRMGDGNWPTANYADVPPNSHVVKYQIDKIKSMGRYDGLTLNGYFVRGTFHNPVNTISIAKEVGLTDGRSVEIDGNIYKFRGINDMINNHPPEMINILNSKLMEAYDKLVAQNAYADKIGSSIEEEEEINNE